jgi:putative glycosyltransferase (TIGR04372 family)
MSILQNFNKHFEQIKKGGIVVVVKKLRTLFYIILQIPIYLISIPAVILIRLIRPWFLIRWGVLHSGRIGHFAKETELYCCERDAKINIPSQRYIDFFYLGKKYVCNRQLEKMWRRRIIILPTWLLAPLCNVNRFISIFVSGGNNHEIWHDIRDVHNLLERFEPHLNFTDDEETKGKKILTEFGIPEGAKFVCLLVRDSGYLDRHKKYEYLKRWSYHSYRDGDIDKYVLATEELAKRGYYVFRMGINVLKPLKSSNPKVIDYANSKIRSDFMDIYLGAKCRFCISTAAGFDEIPTIFRKPIAYTGHVPIAVIETHNKETLILTKHHINKRNQKELTVSEIFSSNVALCFSSADFELNGIKLEDNSPKEIRDLAIEMDERLNGNWNETEEDILLQKKFWLIFKKNIKNLNLKKPIHGKIKSKFGAKFLRENQNWIR